MQIENFKRWHWAVIGLVMGLIFSYTWQDHDVVGDKTYELAEIKQVTFEREALSKSREDDPKSDRAILQDVKVEPPVLDYMNRPRSIVVGKRLRLNPKDQKEYLVPFYYYSSIPYRPRLISEDEMKPAHAGQDPTVLDFLAAAQKTNPLLHYRYAWELQGKSFTALWAIGGVVVIGGIWPTVLQLLMGAGFGRPPKSASEKENEDYLSRFGKGKKEPLPVLAAKGPTEEDRDRLDEMNAALEGQLAAAGMSVTTSTAASANSDDSAAGAKIVELNAGPVQPSVAVQEEHHQETEEERRKRFAAGDFYPVARGNKKA